MDFKKIIENFKGTAIYASYLYGDDYYKSHNTEIMQRKKKVYAGEFGVVQNPFMANHTLPSGFFKLIVDQKVQYLLGNGVAFENDESVNDYFYQPYDEIALDLATTASKKGVAWLYAHKNGGKLKFSEVAPEQIFPLFDEYGVLNTAIRAYADGNKTIILVYTKDGVERYEVDNRGKETQSGAFGHYNTKVVYNGRVERESDMVFNSVPFIPFYNNVEKMSDLDRIKPLIDIYDVVNSDFANNIDDMQDAFFTLKGFSGEVKELQRFMQQLKAAKAAGVPTDGDLDVNQLQVPVEARETFLNRTSKDIFKYSMSVDTSDLEGGSITNVVIKSMFANLDLKANQFESEFRKFMRKLINFINANDGKALVGEFTLDRSMIVNKQETIETKAAEIEGLVKLLGFVSDETLLSLIPYDIDLVDELKKIEAQKAREPVQLGLGE